MFNQAKEMSDMLTQEHIIAGEPSGGVPNHDELATGMFRRMKRGRDEASQGKQKRSKEDFDDRAVRDKVLPRMVILMRKKNIKDPTKLRLLSCTIRKVYSERA